MTKENKEKQIELFKKRRKRINLWFQEGSYMIDQNQCPLCKKWFTTYTGNTGGLLQHITIIAKREVIAKALGEMKTTPHFKFWKRFTKPSEVFYKPRYWTI